MLVTEQGRANPPRPALLESEDLVGFKLLDRVALFNKAGERSDLPVSFSVQGDRRFKILVTDLAEGTWQVRKDGKVFIPAASVSDEAGVLYFEGPAGEYRLLR
ncbi:MAG TPA: hypothetical protein VM123_14055 [archaeon]|nr:hypothetical protein [archaeon]